MSGAKKPILFISYSHKDELEKPRAGDTQWLAFVVGFLRVAFPDEGAVIWFDEKLTGGEAWRAEIARRLRECDVFVVLVSRHSLASDCVKCENAAIRKRQANGEKVLFYPILLTPTPKPALALVADKNFRPRGGKALSGYEAHERAEHLAEAAEEQRDEASQGCDAAGSHSERARDATLDGFVATLLAMTVAGWRILTIDSPENLDSCRRAHRSPARSIGSTQRQIIRILEFECATELDARRNFMFTGSVASGESGGRCG